MISYILFITNALSSAPFFRRADNSYLCSATNCSDDLFITGGVKVNGILRYYYNNVTARLIKRLHRRFRVSSKRQYHLKSKRHIKVKRGRGVARTLQPAPPPPAWLRPWKKIKYCLLASNLSGIWHYLPWPRNDRKFNLHHLREKSVIFKVAVLTPKPGIHIGPHCSLNSTISVSFISRFFSYLCFIIISQRHDIAYLF